MSSFGLFESAVTSDYEVGLSKQASKDNLAAAVYDVKEKLGGFLFAAASLEEFRDRVAITKNDQSLHKLIEAHLPPVTGTVRRIAGKNSILEREFRTRQAEATTPAAPATSTPTTSPGTGTPAAGMAPLTNNPDPVTPSQSVPPAVGANTLAGSRKTACYPGCEKNEAHAAKFHNKDKEARRRWADVNGNSAGPGVNDPTGGLLGETALPGQHPHPQPMGGLGDVAHSPVTTSPGPRQVLPMPPDAGMKGTPAQAIKAGPPPGIAAARRRGTLESVVDTKSTFKDEQGKELKPKGDFKGYLNKVDQGGPAKVKRNFASKEAAAIYIDWCRANDLSPARLSSLDAYATALPEADYFRLSNTILAWEDEHHPKVPSTDLKKKDKVAGAAYGPNLSQREPRDERPYRGPGRSLADQQAARDKATQQAAQARVSDPMRHYTAWCNQNGYKRLSANNISHYARGNPQLAYFLGMRCKEAIRTARLGRRRRTAAPDYLQKADDALTQLLNQKAEEFQQTIQPLQQALVTVQQAEQLAQQANPLNVLPTPGTVNVMPGQPQSPAAQIGMPDPNQPDISGLVQALQPGGGAMGGIAPQGDTPGGGSGGPPPAAAGGGLPPDMDPGQQQIAASRRRHGGGVTDLWDQWNKSRGDLPRGGEVDYEQFQNEKGVGDRAIKKLKNQHSQGTTVGSRRRRRAAWDEESDYTNTDDFHNFNDRGGYKHPGQERGWKGSFDEDQYAPYTGERYTKGDAHVHGGPGPEGGRYYVHTPHGRSGPHGTHDEAFDAAEPHLQQQQEIAQGQGTLPLGLPGEQRAAGVRPNFSRGRKAALTKKAWSGWGPSQFPKTREVTGWKWDNHLSGYTASRPERFACDCGNSFNTPTGFQRCACGKQWNSYVIGNGGSNKEASADKYLVREIPVRHDVIVANRKLTRSNTVQLVDKQGNIHNLVDPGELGEGEDAGHPSMKYPPKDWARRGDGAKWQKSPIGK